MDRKLGNLFLTLISSMLLVNGGMAVSGSNVQAIQESITMRKPISYIKSSEIKPYPKKISVKKDRIVVSLKEQRAYLMRGKKLRYEFYVSTGTKSKNRQTPKGHYRINSYRAPWFYSYQEREGARYAVGFLDGGLYLFHENPRNINHRTIKSVAKKLGRKPSSHGCVHLSTRDAKWFYYHAPTGLRVIVK
ncbi:L,D-transpeptidase [Lactobacillus sp. ESL0791]|uniref:L,D-transpeptidase n=1 Tax=Lactobacillus sp. ESL0791 TaxID=2983234 RepID=UPI0023F8BEE2|nr:L,D-transpeptidase [Lactobacillus sp. ESL0791]MDF7639730.1 L,D-transpeptidase [Lactobacillus sp. ESL0791]